MTIDYEKKYEELKSSILELSCTKSIRMIDLIYYKEEDIVEYSKELLAYKLAEELLKQSIIKFDVREDNNEHILTAKIKIQK